MKFFLSLMLLSSTLVANAGIVLYYHCTVDSKVIKTKQNEEAVRLKDCKKNNSKIVSSLTNKSIFYVLADSRATCNNVEVASIRKCSVGQNVTLSNESVHLLDLNKSNELVYVQGNPSK